MSRLLLKLSGEALGGSEGFGFDHEVLNKLSLEILKVIETGHEVGLVLGGGNLVRGKGFAELGSDRVVGDQMGMLATVMNALAFSSHLTRNHVPHQVFSAAGIPGITSSYQRSGALDCFASGKVGLFSGGIGNPFFTTDTAACLRAIELDCDMVIKATNVDGIYSADPKLDSTAKRIDTLSFQEVIDKNLGVMDMTAVLLCRDHKMPILVCDIDEEDSLLRAANGETIGSMVN